MLSNWLSIIAGVFYAILGAVVIIYKFFAIPLEANVAYPLGVLLILYGLFRMYRAIKGLREVGDDKE